jgi:hypothetical protein
MIRERDGVCLFFDYFLRNVSVVCRCLNSAKFMMMMILRTDTRHILLSAIQCLMITISFDLLLSIGMCGRKIASETPPEMQRDATTMLNSMA